MATKMAGELKFQIEVLKRLYTGKTIKMIYVKASVGNFAWGFNHIWYGFDNGEFLRSMDKSFIVTPTTAECYNGNYTESNLEIESGYFLSNDTVAISDPVEIKDGRKKRKIVKLTSSNISVSIDSRYLDYFDEDVRFILKDEFSPVLILNKNLSVVIGLIYPFVMKR